MIDNISDKKQVPITRTNRLMSKDDDIIQAPKEKEEQANNAEKSASKSQSRNRRRFGSYRRDRQKSVSKSIQRQ